MKKILAILFLFFISCTIAHADSSSLALSSISVSGSSTYMGLALNPSFNANITQYRVRAQNNVNAVNISASLKDSKSKIVSGVGKNQTIVVGNNRFEIQVMDVNKNIQTYVVVVSREDESGNIPTYLYSGLLKSLSVEEYALFFDRTQLDYDIEVPNSITKLTINAVPVESDLRVEIAGNQNFVVGNNAVDIILKDSSNQIIRTYRINVKRDPVEQQSKEKDIYYTLKNSNSDPVEIKLEVPQTMIGTTLQYLVQSDKNVVFDYLNSSNQITHTLGIQYKNVTNQNMDINLETSIDTNFSSSEFKDQRLILLDLKQESYPGKVNITINTKGIYDNNSTIELYSKKNNTYTKLIDLKTSNDKLSFNTTKGGQYVMVFKKVNTTHYDDVSVYIMTVLVMLNLLAIIRLTKVIRK